MYCAVLETTYDDKVAQGKALKSDRKILGRDVAAVRGQVLRLRCMTLL